MKADLKLLAEKLVAEASLKGLTVSFAESCTGGMIASSVTDIPGASVVFLGSAVTYSNDAKIRILGVARDIIAEHGAVSSLCAEKMADGARRIFGSDVALSVTGIAGPDGGSREKPVGTVWFGISTKEATNTFMKKFSGERADIRNAAVKEALAAILERMQ